jgi:hypothetical protein
MTTGFERLVEAVGTGPVDGELEVPMRFGVEGERQVDTPVRHHAPHLGAAEA